MQRFTIFLSVLVLTALALSIAACGGSSGGSNEAVDKGRTKFIGTCASCHGQDAKGIPKQGKDLTNNAFVKSKSDDDLLYFLKIGRPAGDPDNTQGVDMPPRGGNPALQDADLKNIIAYLRTLSP